ncbi:MAG TPA: HEPN domain-containing protein [Elainellaceae cyanobacterium]
MDNQIFADEIFGFHIQQAAEKILKAWIAAIGDVYPFTHDLGVLLQQLEQQGYEVSPFWDLLEYNAFAVQLRYDAISTDDIPIDREVALNQVRSLYDRVQAYI